ncbi:MAG: molecular chaperone TorD family protein [Chloroflexi bacterium]|nr:molecular chaperone TorD family protein [Chloroflexota bacterium]
MNPLNETDIARLKGFARLFLFEPQAQDLRVEFTRLFTLNVFPYASVYLDAEALLNTQTTARVQVAYARTAFEPDPALAIGAPDHFGVELLFVTHLWETGRAADEFLNAEVLPWAGIFLHAVERNAHEEYYREAAREAHAWLMAQTGPSDWTLAPDPLEADDLDAVVARLITPSRTGLFLSKADLARIARDVNLPLGFGDRALMLTSLFRAAGEYERVSNLLGALKAEAHAWNEFYAAEAQEFPAGANIAQNWLRRTTATLEWLKGMEQVAV